MNIVTIDLLYLDIEEAIASFLVPNGNESILIETGPHSCFERLRSEILAQDLTLSDIKHVFISHIHLDHAGAAWAFAEMGAKIYLHPFGEKHMAEPSKLMASARKIYGDDMDRLWGKMNSIDIGQLQTIDHEEVVKIGNIEVQAWHTPGHAVHHIAWQIGNKLFAGDVAGVKIGNGPAMPPCPPPDINIEHWQASINLIRSLDIESLYLTHFGEIIDVEGHLNQLEKCLLAWANWIKPYWETDKKAPGIIPDFQRFVDDQLRDYGLTAKEVAQYEAANPVWMSVAGLMRYWDKKNR